MPPQSRGAKPPPTTLYSKSTPNLQTLGSLRKANEGITNGASPTVPSNADSSHTPTDLSSPAGNAIVDKFPLGSDGQPRRRASETSGQSDDGSEDEENSTVSNLPKRPIYHHHSRSHTYLAPSAFAPPFYNRPPTPLPPSPSLTSLLRPNFSSANSRPTTPDPSSDEGITQRTGELTGTQTPNSAAASTLTSSFRQAKPVARASPKVPTYEYYGFTLYLTSSLAFIFYLLWAFLPSPFLHQLGIYYYPNRWWALAIPAWTVMLIVYIYVALASYNTGYLTLPMNSVECLVDEAANIAVVDRSGAMVLTDRPSWQTAEPEGSTTASSARSRKKSSQGAGKGRHAGDGGRQDGWARANHQDDSLPELDWKSVWNEGTNAVMDIPIGGVCEILYGREASDDDY